MSKPQANARVNVETSGAQKALTKLKGSFSGFAKDVGSKMKGLAVGAMAGVGAGIAASLKSGLDQKIQLENSEALMKSLMGGADKAAQAMAMLGKEAEENPIFSKSDIVAAGTQLASFADGSVEKLNGLVESAQLLAASNPGATIADAGIAMKNALAGDYVSLQERFDISPAEIKRLKEAGLSGKKLIDALLKGKGITQQTLTDMANTTGGTISKMKNQIAGMALQVVEGLLPVFQEKSAQFMAWFAENKTQIISFIQSAVKVTIAGIEFISAFFGGVKQVIQDVASFAGGWFESISSNFSLSNVAAWLGSVAALVPSTIASLLTTAVGMIVKALAWLGKTVWTGILSAIPNLWKVLLGFIKDLSPKLFGLLGGDNIMKSLDDVTGSISDAVAKPFDAITGVADKATGKAWETTGGLAKNAIGADSMMAGANAANDARAQQEAEKQRNAKAQPVQKIQLNVNAQRAHGMQFSA